jgi:hypothetical protein
MGGLGNQLFQIFAMISHALENDLSIIFPYNENSNGFTERKVYWNSFLSSINYLIKSDIPQMDFMREKGFEYNKIVKVFGKDIMLYGYYQSYKYFEDKYDIICNMIELEKKRNFVKTKYKQYDLNNSISLHFRIGDYIHIQDKHPILDISYYENALNEVVNNFPNVKKIYWFTEKKDFIEARNIIIELSSKFKNLTIMYIKNIEEDWEEMLLMSLCTHNIIANSTFSWWGAYFNDNPKKMVCYPSKWFGPALFHQTYDLFPPTWTKINC